VSVHLERSKWRVRWREDGAQRSRVFDMEIDARRFDRDNRRRLQRKRARHTEQEEIRLWARTHPVAAGDDWIYIAAVKSLRRIKIGLSRDPLNRLRGIQTGMPAKVDLVLLMPGDRHIERVLLEHTSAFAVEGAGSEWRTLEALDVVVSYIRERASWLEFRQIAATGLRAE
jgi:hypothetical protein